MMIAAKARMTARVPKMMLIVFWLFEDPAEARCFVTEVVAVV